MTGPQTSADYTVTSAVLEHFSFRPFKSALNSCKYYLTCNVNLTYM